MSNLIYAKMSAVMKEIGFVAKDRKNDAQGFKFRGIDQFVNSLYPALTKHGVFMTPRATRFESQLKDVVRGSGKPGVDKHVSIMMEYDFYAEDGSKVTVGPVPAEGMDSGDKATNKALSAALKYALIQTFSIPTEDMAEADFESPTIGTAVTGNAVPAPTPPVVQQATSPVATPVAATTAAKPATVSPFRKAPAEKVATPTAPAVATAAGADGWDG